MGIKTIVLHGQEKVDRPTGNFVDIQMGLEPKIRVAHLI